MSDQPQFNQLSVKLQSPLAKWVKIIDPLYVQFIPSSIRHRRNTKQAKLNDVTVIALLCWQVVLGITNQYAYYRFLKSLHILNLPERSRFNRISNRGEQLLQLIRIGLVQKLRLKPRYTIIDSFPMPLCKSIRNRRAKVFRNQANIGYNATKKQWYYGFKGSFEVTDQGLVVAYTITKASIHDIKMVRTLIDDYASPHILADVGYLSQRLRKSLSQKNIQFWTPRRRNMTPARTNQRLLNRQRRRIETVFSRWGTLFDVEHNRGRTLMGFQTRLEQCLFVDTWHQIN